MDPLFAGNPVATINNNVTTNADTAIPAEEQPADQVIGIAAQVAAPFLHSAKAVNALSTALNLSPLAVHLGFSLAHALAGLFHHTKKS